ncbi:MAG: hypothetical protein ACD_8C00084G0002 [uncultured bacterium]|nr:MAG: hypothetical protein ACD_8C00084G0002 [uncultured bacterium]
MRILIVEDQENLAKLVQKGLTAEGFTADYVLDGEMAQNRIDLSHQDYDLIILDFMLPKKSGLEILTDTRGKNITTPILMLTARDDKKDITAGLDAGADDYLTKPFSFEELISRIRAILRRPKASLPMELCCRNVKLNPATKCVTCNNLPVHLTLKEFGLLEYLMRHPDEAKTREDILSGVWDFAFDSFANVVDVHITNIRKKLGDTDNTLIETIRGIGYKINTD